MKFDEHAVMPFVPRTGRRRATEVGIAVGALNRMLDLGRPEYVRTALDQNRKIEVASAPVIRAAESSPIRSECETGPFWAGQALNEAEAITGEVPPYSSSKA